MNTGVQRSGATPPAARTATTPALGPEPGNVFGQGKNAPLIAMAHEIPYVATATVAGLRDLEAKAERAMTFRGARYLHVLVPCPLGWGTAPGDTIRIARLAEQTGLFPVFEAVDGEVTSVSPIRRKVPVEEYLRLQTRYAHLFTSAHGAEVITRLQAIADRNISRLRPAAGPGRDGAAVMTSHASGPPPFAITLDVGSSLANKTGSWRTQRPVYIDRLPPCNNACPAGENIQQWLYHAEEGGYQAAWRQIMADNPLPGGHGPGLLPAVRDRLQPGPAGRRRSASTRSSGSSATRPSRKAGPSPEPAPPTGRRVLVVGAGPAGLSAAYHLALAGHQVTIRDSAPEPGGMMRYGIPAYRLPRDVLDAEISRILALGVRLEAGQTVTEHHRGDGRRPVRRGVPGRRRPGRPAGVHPGRRLGPDPGRGPLPARGGRGRAAAAGPAGGGVRRRQHRHGRGPDRAAARRHRRDRGVPPDPGPDARARQRGGRSRRGGHHDALAVHHRRGLRRHPDHREDAAGRDRVPAADRGVRGAGGGRRGPRPGPGDRTRPARRRARGRVRPRHGPGRPEHDDRAPGRLRRRGHDPVRAHRDRGHRPRQEGRQEHRRLAARRRPGRRPPSTRWPPSAGSTRGTTPTRRPPSGRSWRSPAGSPPSTR